MGPVNTSIDVLKRTRTNSVWNKASDDSKWACDDIARFNTLKKMHIASFCFVRVNRVQNIAFELDNNAFFISCQKRIRSSD